jgi:nicotinate-nucleotide--dimethylbenzimidazole phosphoribosyltransferase
MSTDFNSPRGQVPTPDACAESAARDRQTQLTKPPGALGRLEELACWLAGRLRNPTPAMPRSEIFVFAADHGVAVRGVSAFPQAVTASMLANFAHGGAAINVLAALEGCRIEVVDVGVASIGAPPAGIRNQRIRSGTRDLVAEPALTVAETRAALGVGEHCANEAIERGAQLLIAGEMGIANTTSAACLICAYTGASPAQVVGRGTGVDDAGLQRKVAAVEAALQRAQCATSFALKRGPSDVPHMLARSAAISADPPAEAAALKVLAELGGLEIAAMAGFYLQAGQRGVPVLLDGYISGAAALAAVAMDPGVRQWMLASHASAEPGHSVALRALDLEPLIGLGLRLGEGSGAALTLPIIRAALALHGKMATFAEASVPGRIE